MILIIKLYITFFKIALFTFGGGYAMLPLIQEEMINNAWLTVDQFIDMVAVSQMTPGAIAMNTATFVGFKLAGIPGVLATTLGLISPSLIIITIIAALISKYKDNPLVENAWKGIRPAVVGLIMVAVISLGQEVIVSYQGLIIAAIALFLIAKIKLHPILVIIVSGSLGLLFGLI